MKQRAKASVPCQFLLRFQFEISYEKQVLVDQMINVASYGGLGSGPIMQRTVRYGQQRYRAIDESDYCSLACNGVKYGYGKNMIKS